MTMVEEIVLAIDPALRKIEEILLWKNKLKTVLVFSFVHLVFWLFIIYNVRIYCIIASVFLFFHLLDAYRTKKRRELNKLKNQPPKKVIENICPLGRYIIFVQKKTSLWLTSLRNLKEKNKVQYFLALFLFWSMLAVIGCKIRGLYLSYAMFWLVFFLPPILHYELPKKALRKCLPLLEQLDQSMKYERRSVLDKNDLLVDVRLPKMGIDDDEQEDEYLSPFKFDENEGRDVLERLDDGEDDDDADEYLAHHDAVAAGIDDDEEVEEEFEYEVHQPRHRTHNVDQEKQEKNQEDEEDDEEENSTKYIVREMKKKIIKPATTTKSGRKYDALNDESDDEVDESMLPTESLPSYMDVSGNTSEHSFQFNYAGKDGGQQIKGDRVLRMRATKNRPSLFDYYGGEAKTTQQRSNKLNEHDIDETFDFLDEELKKY